MLGLHVNKLREELITLQGKVEGIKKDLGTKIDEDSFDAIID